MSIAIDRRTFLVTGAGAGAFVLQGAIGAQAARANSDGAGQMFDAIAEQLLREFPESATSLGLDQGPRKQLKHRLVDRTPEGVERRAAQAKARLDWVRGAMSGLDGPELLDAEVTVAAHEIAVEGHAFGFGDAINLDPDMGYRNSPYVVAQNKGAFVQLPDFLDARHGIEAVEDADAYLDRVKDYAKGLAGETNRLRADRAQGVVAPDFLLGKTLQMMRAGLAVPLDEQSIVRNFIAKRRASNLPETLDAALAGLMKEQVLPALASQIGELAQHAAIAGKKAGVWALPDGEAYYRWALKAGTTTTLSPQEVHRLGLEQLKIIQDRMDKVLKANGMTGGSVAERMSALAARPDQIYPNSPAGREQLLRYVRELVDESRRRMPRAFRTLVPARLEVKRVPPEIENGAAGAYAGPGPIDGSEPGSYYINLRDTANQPKYGLASLSYHEAIPGHVWQGEFAYKQSLLRSLLVFNAYSEGWALYAEQIADELGAYGDNPLGELGYLQANAFRCCRLVVDTGIHALKWSRAEAISWFMVANGSHFDEVQGEVDRYCAWPGQACGYKVGQIAINRARDRAKARLGDRFDPRDFNDAVVLGGSVPMTLLDRVIERSMAAEAA